MRNLSERISDANGFINDHVERDSSYAKKTSIGRFFSRTLSSFRKTNYVRPDERIYERLNRITNPWQRLKESLASFESTAIAQQSPNKWQETAQNLGPLNNDIKSFVMHRFRDTLPQSFRTNLIVCDDSQGTESVRLCVSLPGEGNNDYEYVIGKDIFERYEDREKALLLALPGAIEERTEDQLSFQELVILLDR